MLSSKRENERNYNMVNFIRKIIFLIEKIAFNILLKLKIVIKLIYIMLEE